MIDSAAPTSRRIMEVAEANAFVVLAEELHFGRAAQRLQMGQPPLSRLIQKLERTLGAPLFNRTSREVELTVAGRALLEPARERSEERRVGKECRSASCGVQYYKSTA